MYSKFNEGCVGKISIFTFKIKQMFFEAERVCKDMLSNNMFILDHKMLEFLVTFENT